MGIIADTLKRIGIALPRDQRTEVARLDSEFEEMEAEIQRLQADNLKLQANVKPLEREVERLKEQVVKGRSKSDDLPEIRERLLCALGHGSLLNNELAKALGISEEAVEFHAEEMEQMNLVHGLRTNLMPISKAE